MSELKPYAASVGSKKEQIRDMFDSIAPRYDLLNHVLSVGVDKYWRRVLIRDLVRQKPSNVLDVATGTGDLAIAIVKKGLRVTGADISPAMLEKAREKAAKAGLDISFVLSDAEQLAFEDAGFDVVTAAFGVRNFTDPLGGLSQMGRVLKKGGVIYVLEFSRPGNSLLSAMFRLYFHRILPAVGKMVSKDPGAYKYLPMSVDSFASGREFADMLSQAGFSEVTMRRMTGGIATLYKARK